jgi:RNA polymerase sigma-70 factor (ECF subfamily)
MREISDEQLMQDYAAGNTAAFETLYGRYRKPLYRYVLRQVGDEATANDLYQGTWERIIKARNRYRSAAPFAAWMFRIAHNHLVDHWRRQRNTVSTEDMELAATEAGPARQAGCDEHHQLLQQAIRGLPDNQKQTLMLRLEADMGLADIGRITGVGRETVKSRLRYAVAKLKQVLQS